MWRIVFFEDCTPAVAVAGTVMRCTPTTSSRWRWASGTPPRHADRFKAVEDQKPVEAPHLQKLIEQPIQVRNDFRFR